MTGSPKIILFANTDWYLYNFRLALIEALREEGWEVVLVSPPGDYGERLRALGFRWIPLPFSIRSINPLQELALLKKLVELYRRERPQVVHHFTIKCVIYGSLAARWSGPVARVNAVTGLGHVFTDPGLKAVWFRPLVRCLYRLALGGPRVRTIFQNADDLERFIHWGLVERGNTALIRGSGVDGSRFRRLPGRPEGASSGEQTVKILFASRLLREKGLLELVAAFQKLRTDNPEAELLIAGDLYPDNPSSLTEQELDALGALAGITVLGHVENMVDLLRQVDIVTLPSYREGTPRILIEAAAMELPIVATDIPGCRGLVQHGINGLLIPVKRVTPLATALQQLVVDRRLRVHLGRAGRRIVLADFEQRQVNVRTLSLYNELVAS